MHQANRAEMRELMQHVKAIRNFSKIEQSTVAKEPMLRPKR